MQHLPRAQEQPRLMVEKVISKAAPSKPRKIRFNPLLSMIDSLVSISQARPPIRWRQPPIYPNDGKGQKLVFSN